MRAAKRAARQPAEVIVAAAELRCGRTRKNQLGLWRESPAGGAFESRGAESPPQSLDETETPIMQSLAVLATKWRTRSPFTRANDSLAISVALLTAAAPAGSRAYPLAQDSEGDSEVVLGTIEPDHTFPWVGMSAGPSPAKASRSVSWRRAGAFLACLSHARRS